MPIDAHIVGSSPTFVPPAHHGGGVIDVHVVVLPADRLLHKRLGDARAAHLHPVGILGETGRVRNALGEALPADRDVRRHGDAVLLGGVSVGGTGGRIQIQIQIQCYPDHLLHTVSHTVPTKAKLHEWQISPDGICLALSRGRVILLSASSPPASPRACGKPSCDPAAVHPCFPLLSPSSPSPSPSPLPPVLPLPPPTHHECAVHLPAVQQQLLSHEIIHAEGAAQLDIPAAWGTREV